MLGPKNINSVVGSKFFFRRSQLKLYPLEQHIFVQMKTKCCFNWIKTPPANKDDFQSECIPLMDCKDTEKGSHCYAATLQALG